VEQFTNVDARRGAADRGVVLGVTAAAIFYWKLAMKIEKLASHNEAREALVLSVASVTAIMLTAYLLLLILY
jgi:hypothetical protein